MIKALTVFLFCLLSVSMPAQEFSISCAIKPVQKTGYYKIMLPAEIVAHSAGGYQDIRLFDDKGREMPYIFREESPYSAVSGFKEYEIKEHEIQTQKKESRIVIHNRNNEILTSLNLVIRNSEVVKEITIRGSDDGSNWYIIRKANPEKTGSFDETSSLFQISFPGSNYQLIELTTSNKKSDPVQFLKIGYFDSQTIKGLYTGLPVARISQTDSSNRKTYIKVFFPRPFEVSRFTAVFTGPEFYRRNARMAIPQISDGKRTNRYFARFEITTGKPHEWETEKVKTGELLLEIDNSDNPPLRITSFNAFQLNKYLLAKLDSGMSYSLKSGNARLQHPDYDLKYFSENITELAGTISPVIVSETKNGAPAKSYITKTILWGVIILVIGLLGFLSIRMIGEMRRKED